MVTQNKDLALATLVKGLMGGRLRIIYQQHMRLGRLKPSFIHTLRLEPRRCLANPTVTRHHVERVQLESWRYSHRRQCVLTEDVIWALNTVPAVAPQLAPLRSKSPVAISADFGQFWLG